MTCASGGIGAGSADAGWRRGIFAGAGDGVRVAYANIQRRFNRMLAGGQRDHTDNEGETVRDSEQGHSCLSVQVSCIHGRDNTGDIHKFALLVGA